MSKPLQRGEVTVRLEPVIAEWTLRSIWLAEMPRWVTYEGKVQSWVQQLIQPRRTVHRG
jgi:hypothetical protein